MREIYFTNADGEGMGAGQRETGMKPGVDAVDGFSSEALSHSPRERSEGTGEQVETVIRLSPMEELNL